MRINDLNFAEAFPAHQTNQNPPGPFCYWTEGPIMRAKALKDKKVQDKLTLTEGIGIIIALALLGGLTFGVVAV
jgi:hypothetical protein